MSFFIFTILLTWIDPLLASFFYNFHFSKNFPIVTNFLFLHEELFHLPSLLVLCFCSYFLFLNWKKKQIFLLKNILSIFLSISFIYISLFALKPLWNRPRPIETYIYQKEKDFVPFYKIDVVSNWSQRISTSFPSGHAATSSSLLSILPTLNRYRKKKLYKISLWVVIPFIGIQSLIRILLGKHFFSDISLGIILAYSIIKLTNKIIFRHKSTYNKTTNSNI